MCFKLTVVIALVSVASLGLSNELKNKRQVGSAVIEKDDHQAEETGFGNGAVVGGSKYFQYIHVPAKDHYEHGHRRGNEHHFIERHEKAHPHEGEFKTKVRWGDKHGGYGEHYYDYNHAGHDHDGDGEESQKNEEYAPYEQQAETKDVLQYSEQPQRGKREPAAKDDVEFIDDRARSLAYTGNTPRHGGNYRAAPGYDSNPNRGKRERKQKNQFQDSELVFERDLGFVVDKKTGRKYELKPVDY